MFYPTLSPGAEAREVTQAWGGLDRRERGAEGSFREMENLTGDRYPLLSPRAPRRRVFAGAGPVRGLCVREGHLLCVVGTALYIDGMPVRDFSLPSGEASETVPDYGPECPCQMVSMGAWVVFFPDKKYFNLMEYLDTSRPTAEVGDKGSLEATVNLSPGTENQVTYELCSRDGTVYGSLPTSPPEAPEEGELWLDGDTLKTWASGLWEEIPQVYVKISAPGIGRGFSRYDGVELRLTGVPWGTGDSVPDFACLEQAEPGYIVVPGTVTGTRVQTGGQVFLRRGVPDMDYVVECGNRLWGCRYGYVFDHQLGANRVVNEIYASALGDFKNWNQFRGLSTDSYAASRGSGGPFTGAVTYQGHPTFFKAGCIETVYPSETGAHQMVTTSCRGCLPGTLAEVDEVLYYCTGREVVAFDGSYPRSVSRALGPLAETAGCAGRLGQKYYLQLPGQGLLVLDTAAGLWHREDNPGATAFAGDGRRLYFARGGEIWQPEGGGSEAVAWYAETGPLGLSLAGSKFLSRLTLRLRLEPGAWADVYLSTDEGPWEHKGHLAASPRLRSQTLPVLPRRCDTLRLRLEGQGDCQVYSLAKTIEEGSDVW